MQHTPETRLSLLQRVRDRAAGADWEEFVAIYEPLIYRVARKRGLQDADARDVTQEVLVAVSTAIDRWAPNGRKGAFRSWLFRITQNLTINLLVKQARHGLATGDPETLQTLLEAPAPQQDTAVFCDEYRRQLFRRAANQVRASVRYHTWLAFWQTCVAGQPIEQVATELNMSVGSVYAARSRVTARLNETIRQLEQQD